MPPYFARHLYSVAQHTHELELGETRLLHDTLLVYPAEKFYFRIALSLEGLPLGTGLRCRCKERPAANLPAAHTVSGCI